MTAGCRVAVDDRVLQAVSLHGAGRLRLSSSLVALSTSTAPYCNSRIPQLGKLSCSGTRQRIPSQCTRAASPGARTRHADISNASQRPKGLPTQHAAARIRRYHENAHTVRSQKQVLYHPPISTTASGSSLALCSLVVLDRSIFLFHSVNVASSLSTTASSSCCPMPTAHAILT